MNIFIHNNLFCKLNVMKRCNVILAKFIRECEEMLIGIFLDIPETLIDAKRSVFHLKYAK